ncbi:MAG TPA: YaaR family protein [Thermoanaerobacterales bacterium]|nr:YaaR family protein [Thermoanaerobacterales bacterium]
MKIRDVTSRPISRTSSRSKGTGAVKGKFGDYFSNADDKIVREKLDILLTKIDRQGEILVEKKTINELAKYRKLIRDFINETVKNGLENEKGSSWGRGGKLKSHTIINKIDEKLLLLAEEILNQEEGNISLLNIIGEIKGLLVDLYV